MTDETPALIIDEHTGAQPWEHPDAMWRKVERLRLMRMRRVTGHRVLPFLQKLDDPASRKLAGKHLADLEVDAKLMEVALRLTDQTLADGGLIFQNAGQDLPFDNGEPQGPLGACGMTWAEVKHHYLHLLTQMIVTEGQSHHKIKVKGILEQRLAALAITDLSQLPRLRQMARFHPVALSEMNHGLHGHLEKILDQEEWLIDALLKLHPIGFLQALRKGLGNYFDRLFVWSPEFLEAVAEGLDHKAKIIAMGEHLLLIEDPEVVRAFGSWAMRELPLPPEKTSSKKKKKKRKRKPPVETRIAQVKAVLGRKFDIFLSCTPGVIREAGHWTNDQLARITDYLPHMNSHVLEALMPLPFDQRIGLIEGLWYKLGRDYVESHMKTPPGTAVIERVVKKLITMNERGSAPTDLKSVLKSSDLFDDCMGAFLK
ncbi:hypothetical protein [Magnetospira sp. QH-2]|uniref:hypothetical protein n=1 Tax=Magnetospira sp. (strain QH-2) TaxID=1288970 RepID=UPI0003E81AEC|nr:hypothetical protein [Magnetospira sp. QH-2]CCQ72684.1 protein of unknown function [Magnetospira sp. QH-2]